MLPVGMGPWALGSLAPERIKRLDLVCDPSEASSETQ